jgi:hypothetical protein
MTYWTWENNLCVLEWGRLCDKYSETPLTSFLTASYLKLACKKTPWSSLKIDSAVNFEHQKTLPILCNKNQELKIFWVQNWKWSKHTAGVDINHSQSPCTSLHVPFIYFPLITIMSVKERYNLITPKKNTDIKDIFEMYDRVQWYSGDD